MDILDYGKSFIHSQSPGSNRVRFWVESWTRLVDERTGHVADWYQCGSCKSEYMWVNTGLFQKDNYDFLPIFGPDGCVIFRRHAWLNPNYQTYTTYDAGTSWAKPLMRLHSAATSRELHDAKAVREATHGDGPIVAQTELYDEAMGLRATIQFPVKTMNIDMNRTLWQVDTGPIALPQLTRETTPQNALQLAFAAFNGPDQAEFVIEAPRKLDSGESVYHYADHKTIAAHNRLFVINEQV